MTSYLLFGYMWKENAVHVLIDQTTLNKLLGLLTLSLLLLILYYCYFIVFVVFI